MPGKREIHDNAGRPISNTVKIIHGQHPVERESRWRWLCNFINPRSATQDFLVVIPPNFKVMPPVIPGDKSDISYNYSIIKPIAAITQIIYGFCQLFPSSEKPINYYGYNAYQFVITPYIVMSFLNLIASVCEPQFPTLYLVEFQPMTATSNTSGAAEEVDRNSLGNREVDLPDTGSAALTVAPLPSGNGVADTPNISSIVGIIASDSETIARSVFSIRRETVFYPPPHEQDPANLTKSPDKAWGALVGCIILVLCAAISPYLAVYFISIPMGGGMSSDLPSSEFFDGWVLQWLVSGLILSLLVFLPSLNSNPRPAFRLFHTLLFICILLFAVAYAIFMVRLIIMIMIYDQNCFTIYA